MDNIIIDFDSTFIKLEALDELAAISLADNLDRESIVEEIKKTTALGMEGKITFPESLERRFKLLSANISHVEKLIIKLKENISDSITKNKQFFVDNSNRIYIISGGFKEYICPVVADFGISDDHVLANKFVFDVAGNIVGFDKSNYLAQENGKVKQVQALRLEGKVCVIGDGYTDYQIKEAGAAETFIAFCENVKRDSVAEKADQVVEDFDIISETLFTN